MTYKCFKIRSQESRLSCITTKAEEGLPTSDFGLPTSDFRLLTSGFELQTSYFKLQTSDLTKCELRISDFWPFRLKAEWLDLRTSHFPVPTSHSRLPTSDFRFPTSNFQLLTSDLTLLFGSIAARSTTRVLMLKVKAQWKGRLYRSRHKREQLNLLLKKQLSTKPTRHPMRFAWRTETMVLPDHLFNCLFKKLLPGKEIPAPVKRIEKH